MYFIKLIELFFAKPGYRTHSSSANILPNLLIVYWFYACNKQLKRFCILESVNGSVKKNQPQSANKIVEN